MSSPKRLTPKMQQLLRDIAKGADPNLVAQFSQILGRETRTSRTLLALLDAGMLRVRQIGGLEISDAGQTWVQVHPQAQARGQ